MFVFCTGLPVPACTGYPGRSGLKKSSKAAYQLYRSVGSICFASRNHVGGDMRRPVIPWIVLAGFGLLAGAAYRYFADDAAEATLANYLRSGFHGMGLALSGWAVHLYFTSRSSEWVKRWPLVVEIVVQSVVMAIVVATVAMGLQAALYGNRTSTTWLIDDFPRIAGVAFVMSVVIGAVFELTRLVG